MYCNQTLQQVFILTGKYMRLNAGKVGALVIVVSTL